MGKTFSYHNKELKKSFIEKYSTISHNKKKPKSYNQKLYYDYLNDNNIKLIVAYGPAGTGKTFLACDTAIQQLKNNLIDKIIITRPVVSVEEDIGFLPGTINEKMDPWTRPIFDIFLDFYPQKEINYMLDNKIIEISPLGYMRGRTFKNSFIIADEMQNSSPNQMLMLLTRIGNNSKIVITGDLQQSDKGTQSGLNDLINKYKYFLLNNNNTDIPEITTIELQNSDIERNPIIEKILNIYNYKEENKEENKKENKESSCIYQPISIKYVKELDNDSAMIPKSQFSKNFK